MISPHTLRIACWVGLVFSAACHRSIEATDCQASKPTTPGDHGCLVPSHPDRDFLLHLPTSYTGSPLPLVIALHGSAGTKEGMNEITCPDKDLTHPACLSQAADRAGFLVVYPDGTRSNKLLPGRSFNQGGGGPRGLRCEFACQDGVDDVAYIGKLLDTLVQVVAYDPKRVFVTGFSNGGGLAHRLACELSPRIAAIAPVGGANQFAGAAPCNPTRAIPILHIHGDEDRCWPFLGGEGTCVEAQAGTGAYVSVAESTVGEAGRPGWVSRLACAATPTMMPLPDLQSDGTSASQLTYSGCRDGVTVSQITVRGAGHTWPGGAQYLSEATIGKTSRDFAASDLILHFFSQVTPR